MIKITKIENEQLEFDDGTKLYSHHDQDCCESHYLSFEHITLGEVAELEFDFSNDDFFKKIDGYGIELIPVKGHPVRVPGYGYNNGYYGSDLILIVDVGATQKKYDVSECQVIEG
jgi:hypothetical protein